jgi:hypothetical protein
MIFAAPAKRKMAQGAIQIRSDVRRYFSLPFKGRVGVGIDGAGTRRTLMGQGTPLIPTPALPLKGREQITSNRPVKHIGPVKKW